MRRGKRGLRTLGPLLLVATALLAMSAGTSRAATWYESGAAITSTKAFKAVLPIKGFLAFLIPKIGVEMKCGALTSEDGLMFTNGEARVALKVSSCATYINETFTEGCDPGVIKVSSIIKPIWVEETTQLLFSPIAGGIFGVIEFGEECPLANSMPLKGSFVNECVAPSCHTSAIIHSVAHNWGLDGLTNSSYPVFLNGILETELVNGSPFSVLGF